MRLEYDRTDPRALLESADALLQHRDLRQAIRAFDAAERAGADADQCSGGRWLAFMLLGEFEAAWLESDAIRLRARPDPHRYWNGEDLRGRSVIVRCLHGLGDTVQFLSYAQRLQDITGRLIIETPPRLLPLAPFFANVGDKSIRFVTWTDNKTADMPGWDLQIEVTELPYIFRTQLGELPIARNYLRLPGPLLTRAAQLMSGSGLPRIGLVWAAGEWNPSRSIPFALLTALIEKHEAEWWNLQGGSAASECRGFAGCPPLRDAGACGEGLIPLAAAIANLDLLITVDTLAAHLAGAMGISCWLLLQHAADWRWMSSRDDSPWYPSLRLFRQPRPGDWAAIVESVRTELDVFLQARTGSIARQA